MRSSFLALLLKRLPGVLALLLLILAGGFILSKGGLFAGNSSEAKTEPTPQQEQSAPILKTPVPLATLTPLKFVAIGDTGSAAPAQFAIASQMVRQYETDPYGFVLMLGDNIYPNGDVEKLGKKAFTDPYLPLLSAGVRFYASLGNHDVKDGFIRENLAFFKMPNTYYSFVHGNAEFFALNTNDFNEVQQKWLENALANSRAEWKVVYGHHPVYSSGLHGNTRVLEKNLKPLLEKYRVPLYLAGHDHDYERFKPVNGVTYIVSGGGGAYLRKFGKVQANSLVRLSKHHFIRWTVQRDQMNFVVLDQNGQVLDRGTLKKPAALPRGNAA